MKSKIIMNNLGLVVCLRTGADKLQSVLQDVANSRFLPGEIVLVDPSHSSTTAELVHKFNRENGLFIKHIGGGIALPAQRNSGIKTIERANKGIEYLTILDEDVRFDPFYLNAVVQEFETLPQALAIGGYDRNLFFSWDIFSKILKAIRRKRSYGMLLKSGVAIPPMPIEGTPRYPCMWIPGHSMSFRIKAFSGSNFAEELGDNGADVDFLLRLRSKGEIFFSSKLSVIRDPMPLLAGLRKDEALLDAQSRWQLSQRHMRLIKPSRVIARALVDCVSNFLSFAISRSSMRRDRSFALASFLLIRIDALGHLSARK